MVFILRDEDVLYILGHNRTYTLGRSRQNDIRIRERSVSSMQAKITTNNESAIISDLDSFHGTQVNSEIINSEEQLTNGDLITVGNFDHTLEFMRDDFKVDIDCNLAMGTKEMLKLAFEELRIEHGTHVNFEEDEQCVTHYVTELVTMQTLKNSPILLYLLEKKLIVTPKYFTEMMAGINKALPMPNFYKFLPPVDEQLQSKGFSFTRTVLKTNRRSLFKNIVFISFHELGRLETFLTECHAAVHEYESGRVFIDTLYEVFSHDHCVLIHGPESTLANIKICEMRLRNENWEKVQQVHEDDLYLSILQCEKIGFKPVLGVQNCQDSSRPVRDHDGDHSNTVTIKHDPITSPVKQQFECKQWVSKRKPKDLSRRVSFKGEIEVVTSTTLDDDDEATPPGLQLNPVIQNTERDKTKSPSPIVSVKKEIPLKQSILSSVMNAESELFKPSRKKRSALVKNPLAIKRFRAQSSKDPLEDSLPETPTSTGDERILRKFENLSALQNKYRHLIFTPIVTKK